MFRLKNSWMLHVAGWMLFLSLPLTIVSRDAPYFFRSEVFSSRYFWLFLLIYAAVFYVNLIVLMPGLFFKQKYLAYGLIFAGGIALTYAGQPFEKLIFSKFNRGQRMPDRARPDEQPPDFRNNVPPPRPDPRERPAVKVDFVSIVLFLVVWTMAMAIRLSEQWRLSERRAILSEAEKAQAELSFFKAQINPHFLFNTLNNIYALAVAKSDHTAESILKLSQMMRYITEEATEDFVPLQDELACLRNYIDLQKLRLSKKTHVNFEVAAPVGEIKIAPLILMTFVENAFKYGVSNRHESAIDIYIHIAEKEILFTCTNRNFDSQAEPGRQGVGIANTRKRLEYLYAGRHRLDVQNNGGFFEVQLNLTNP